TDAAWGLSRLSGRSAMSLAGLARPSATPVTSSSRRTSCRRAALGRMVTTDFEPHSCSPPTGDRTSNSSQRNPASGSGTPGAVQHPSLAAALDAANPAKKGQGIPISEHEDELLSIEDHFGDSASPADYIESFEAFVRANMNAVPAMIAATQRPRELTRAELKQLAMLLDEKGFSEAALRRAYGSARNADIAAHIIGFVRQAA